MKSEETFNVTVGLIGLGKMGEAIAYRLSKNNFEIIAFDPNVKEIKNIENISFEDSIENVAKKTDIIWLMVPAGDITDNVINELSQKLKPGSIIIDGGNSNFHKTKKRYALLKERNINLLDCGTSGGVAGKLGGYSLMIGGDKDVFEKTEEIFKSIAAPNGYNYMGPAGAGHYVKMIHNGVEYSLLQSYAEGFDLLKNNTNYQNLDLETITDTWLNGSVIRSWILELCKNIFAQDQKLNSISGSIGENQTGRWTIDEANKQSVPMDLLKKSLEIRKESRETGGNYGTKIVAMLRHQFGGHLIRKQ